MKRLQLRTATARVLVQGMATTSDASQASQEPWVPGATATGPPVLVAYFAAMNAQDIDRYESTTGRSRWLAGKMALSWLHTARSLRSRSTMYLLVFSMNQIP